MDPRGANESRCEADEDGNCGPSHRPAGRNARDLLRNLQADGRKRNRNKQISCFSASVMIISLTYFNEFAFFLSCDGPSPRARRERSGNSTTPQVRLDQHKTEKSSGENVSVHFPAFANCFRSTAMVVGRRRFFLFTSKME